MPNTLLTPDIIAREALMVLENNLVFAGLVHRDYSDEYGSVGETIRIRRPATFTASEWNGSTITIQDATEGSVPVKMDTILDVSFAVTSKELALSIQDFSEQFLQPALRAHAQALDAKLAQLYDTIPYNSAVGGTPTIADIAALDRILSINKAPQSQRYLVIDPVTKAKYVVLDAVLHLEKSGTTEALREASLGRVLTFDTYMSQNIVQHTKGDLASGATLTATAGSTTGSIASGGANKTIKKGDLFTIAGLTENAPYNQFVCTETKTTDGSGNISGFKFYPAVPSNVSGAVITVKSNAAANLAFHRNAFALVTRPLPAPMGGAVGTTLSYRGMSIRVTYSYDMNAKRNIISVDQLCGTAVLCPELAVRFNG